FQATPRGPEVEFSAAQMSTDAPLTLQYVVIARDADGDVLLAQGDREHPLETRVAAGREQVPAFYTQRRFWMVAGGAAAGVTAVGTVLLVALVAGGTVAAFTGYLLVRGDGTPPGIIGKQTLD
ncbi:MAG: hypothetical protein HY904_04230, partial [Deltaproteobacteria bacterium]|nr:hypothetical protein [Deltaproteobacteria bacterium]